MLFPCGNMDFGGEKLVAGAKQRAARKSSWRALIVQVTTTTRFIGAPDCRVAVLETTLWTDVAPLADLRVLGFVVVMDRLFAKSQHELDQGRWPA